jgi:hypothetical protein
MSVTYRTMTPLKSVVAAVAMCGTLLAERDLPLKMAVIAGHDVVVNTRAGRGADIRVRVTDAENQPVEDATVTAILPGVGAGGSFRGGHMIKTKTTDSDGMAGFEGISLRRTEGEIPIRLVAHRGTQSTSTTVRQRATDTALAPDAGLSKRRKIMMAIAAAGVTSAVLVAILGGQDAGPPAFNATPGNPVTTGPR